MRFEVSDVDRLLHRSSLNTICKCPTSVSASAQQPQRPNPIPVDRQSVIDVCGLRPKQQYPRQRTKAMSLSRTRRSSSWRLPAGISRERHVQPVSLVVDFNWHHPRSCTKRPRTPSVRSWRPRAASELAAGGLCCCQCDHPMHRRRRRVPRLR
jgi:hypothetical protein